MGPICSARLVARIGNPTRFASEAAFASYVGTAPIDVSSGDHNRHRLSRSGDRKLNAVIHIVAVCQSRHPSAPELSTTAAKSPKAKPAAKPNDASNVKSPNRSGELCIETALLRRCASKIRRAISCTDAARTPKGPL
ncbi:MAG: IS110 family transposase [Williamsia sp.]|nr:IS110 family transposase [Williamsia sp.]